MKFPILSDRIRNARTRTSEPSRTALLLPAALTLTGCANLVGFDAASDFACPREAGVSCASMRETLEASAEGRLPWQEADRARRDAALKRVGSGKDEKYGKIGRGDNDALPDDNAREVAPEPTGEEGSGPTRVAGSRNLVTARSTAVTFGDSAHEGAAPKGNAGNARRSGGGDGSEGSEGSAGSPDPDASPRTASLRPHATLPERSREEIVRLWIAPYAAEDGSLHEGRYVHIAVRPSEWKTARVRRTVEPAVVRLPFGRSAAPDVPSEDGDANGTRPDARLRGRRADVLRTLDAVPAARALGADKTDETDETDDSDETYNTYESDGGAR